MGLGLWRRGYWPGLFKASGGEERQETKSVVSVGTGVTEQYG
ncbi:hypothetical protein JMJ77_0010129 [Colletotrichum scovillei]|uniref:Uncharacterized protein n=1 Tax=Colletotrichum scovillei TaxID=1209932 RepID=A0A9P7QV30_9PEZI|nr:hypothetical protein JMJ78_0011508 [Colletotrichum scovillei]KAG7042022.1 hypothetical protein JMJ77_0010129 [Colletotrichum scovillei]KAG7062053.1 hypothetical protein JMJ76_0006336 [Colletotrichum scovillei]